MEKNNTNKGTEFENRCDKSPCKNGIVKTPNKPLNSLGAKPYSFQCKPKISLIRKKNHNRETIMTDFNME